MGPKAISRETLTGMTFAHSPESHGYLCSPEPLALELSLSLFQSLSKAIKLEEEKKLSRV